MRSKRGVGILLVLVIASSLVFATFGLDRDVTFPTSERLLGAWVLDVSASEGPDVPRAPRSLLVQVDPQGRDFVFLLSDGEMRWSASAGGPWLRRLDDSPPSVFESLGLSDQDLQTLLHIVDWWPAVDHLSIRCGDGRFEYRRA